ncbi:D-alanyl-D-alanine carboxypeptidase/D-alanyl-D-alanine-endopeptidase [Alloscardovia venturai]|uniref:D-alanyl-D-alanine carboxypeptidase/D-alanyl-D-alanine-endopeptidase n=1 Tax=Alloscardovia venturai TaxID=1769421 RepID=A0ABW2Y5U9_9BIFI
MSKFIAVTRRRRLTVTLTALFSVIFTVSAVVLDVTGVVPGTLTTLTRIRHDGSVAALNPTHSLRIFSGYTVKDTQAKTIDKTRAQQLVDQTQSELVEGNTATIAIADSSGKIVAGKNVSEGFEPASTMKTLTAFAASVTLDPQQTFDTVVKMDRADTHSTSATLTLIGGGDILLGAGHSDTSHIDGRAGLQTLTDKVVKQLRNRNIDTVSLQYDDSLFGDDTLPTVINAQSSVNANYMNLMEPSSMAIDEARQWNVTPRNLDEEQAEYPARAQYPAAQVASTFASQLKAQGINVESSSSATYSQGTASSQAITLGTVSSAPVYELVQLMLTNSDNSLAQLLGRVLAIKTQNKNTQAGASNAVKGILQQYGINVDNLVIADTSGLASGSKITVQTLIQIQSAYLNPRISTWSAATGMPIAGLTGTLKNRDFGALGRGAIRAKTGTLDEAAALAGNVVRTNRGTLIFVIIVNGNNMSNGVQVINNFAADLPTL